MTQFASTNLLSSPFEHCVHVCFMSGLSFAVDASTTEAGGFIFNV